MYLRFDLALRIDKLSPHNQLIAFPVIISYETYPTTLHPVETKPESIKAFFYSYLTEMIDLEANGCSIMARST